MELVLLKMVPLLWSMLPLCTADNGTSAPENGASGCHKSITHAVNYASCS
jgi:hypothetical protein